MCLREGKLGALIADGAARAAEKLGKGSEKFAMVNKKLEWGAYSLRSLQTATLGFATSVRGACYLRSGSYQPDVKGTVDRYHLDRSRGKVVYDGEKPLRDHRLAHHLQVHTRDLQGRRRDSAG